MTDKDQPEPVVTPWPTKTDENSETVTRSNDPDQNKLV
jgi:hypothetical protein